MPGATASIPKPSVDLHPVINLDPALEYHEQIVSESGRALRGATRLLPRPSEPQKHETADHRRGDTYRDASHKPAG